MTTVPKNEIVEFESSPTHTTYYVNFQNQNIFTTVTGDPSVAALWASETAVQRNLVVGVDVRPRPSDRPNLPTAALILCVNLRCLVYLLNPAGTLPNRLVNFLTDDSCTLVGADVISHMRKLQADYGDRLDVGNGVEVRAIVEDNDHVRKWPDLEFLGKYMLDRTDESEVLRDSWDGVVENRRGGSLTLDQVKHVCIHAYLAYRVGVIVRAPNLRS